MPIRLKLSLAILGTTAASLLIACAAFIVYEKATFRDAMVEKDTVLADVLATNSTVDVYKDPPKLVFGTELLVNIRNMLSNIDFFGSMFNTLIVAVGTTALVLFLDSLAAFTFAKYESPARRRCSDCCCSRSCCRCSSRSSPSSRSW